ncbi:MAG: trypsin-like peptidase domain-containing protein [Planctomycetota bacterium]
MIQPRQLILATVAVGAMPAPGQDPIFALQTDVQRAVARVAPSVVRVETFGGTRRAQETGPAIADGAQAPKKRPQKKDPDEFKAPDEKKEGDEKKGGGLKDLMTPGFKQTQGATTGLVLSADGWIAVSRFALAYDPTTILVTLPDGRAFNAVRKGEDTSRGLALVKIEVDDLPVPELLDPANVQVGQWALALGRTFGLAQPSVHVGIVSATRRIFGRAVQIDANCSPANYGGPVIDLDGRVIGLAAPLSPQGRDAGADWYDSGIGFATTLRDIEPLLSRMREGEVLHRGWLGVATDPKFLGPGARITSVAPGSTAAGMDIKPKDIVLEVEGVKVRHHFDLQMLVAQHLAGDAIHLKVQRGDDTFGTTAFLSQLPEGERTAEKKGRVDDPLPWEQK